MHHLIYSSSATHPLSDKDLQDLLANARLYNERQGVTGLLLYHEGQFMQLLEGEETTIRALYGVIAQDPRHTSVLKLADKYIEARSFPEWAMAFRPLDADAFAQLEGYRTPASLKLAPQGLSAADALLLNLMRQYMLPDEKA
ncbi:BLUF domain-containing protein [Hymenobacter sp.]|uniref:BLUF domain-containing protein n=1 Tax=Hymenobacter sp. TaxID=1898978 RepID=UPI002ED9252F